MGATGRPSVSTPSRAAAVSSSACLARVASSAGLAASAMAAPRQPWRSASAKSWSLASATKRCSRASCSKTRPATRSLSEALCSSKEVTSCLAKPRLARDALAYDSHGMGSDVLRASTQSDVTGSEKTSCTPTRATRFMFIAAAGLGAVAPASSWRGEICRRESSFISRQARRIGMPAHSRRSPCSASSCSSSRCRVSQISKSKPASMSLGTAAAR
mmetsp:Transcript_81410/g.197705  ORF Transcript_81410/g.197705 Transcript_81410/m.197705 type:complete len:216 (+) Transcript_81410:181-828(+)